MAPIDSTELILLSGSEVIDFPELVPAERGIYLVFLDGGRRLLEHTGYFRTETREPVSIGSKLHFYTGSAKNLRRRVVQHFVRDIRTSSLRKTLFSIEHAKQAISRSGTPRCHIRDEKTLSAWLFRNGSVAIGRAANPLAAERLLLQAFASPFNIKGRASPYSDALAGWREAAFPSAPRGPRRAEPNTRPRCRPACLKDFDGND